MNIKKIEKQINIQKEYKKIDMREEHKELDLIIKGARSHNLKSINLNIPANKIIGVVGPSGSGKSTLAFDTIFAEGERRYLESLSSHTRLFLNKVEKPEFDEIQNLSPSIAIEQKNRIKNQRDTLATMTDIYELLSVLYTNIGEIYCHNCGAKIDRDNEDNIAKYLLEKYFEQKIYILFKTPKSIIEEYLSGFTRFVLKDGSLQNLDGQTIETFAKKNKEAYVLYDRLKVKEDSIPRIRESIYKARLLGDGIAHIYILDKNEFKSFSFSLKCSVCNTEQTAPYQNMFSFDDPQYACKTCNGFGNILVLDENKIIPDKNKSILAGAISVLNKPSLKHHFTHMIDFLTKKGVDIRKSYSQLSKKEQNLIFKGGDKYIGINPLFKKLETKQYKVQIKVLLSKYRKTKPCLICEGTRLSKISRSVKIREKSITDLQIMSLGEFSNWLNELNLSEYEFSKVKEVFKQLQNRTNYMNTLGLGYLELNRLARTLSSGEMQRVNIAKHLGAFLVGTTYVLDEPSIGLHPADNKNLISVIKALRDGGNRVLIVEHDLDLIKNFDQVIELGPGSGFSGGQIVYQGIPKKYLEKIKIENSRELRPILPVGPKTRYLKIKGIKERNLKNINFNLPVNRFSCVTGVSGSGKSTLLIDVLYSILAKNLSIFDNVKNIIYKEASGLDYFDSVIVVDQNSVNATQRSVVVTYMSMLKEIRDLFASTKLAKTRAYTASMFSFNAEGKCEHCEGNGKILVDMQFMSDVSMVCEYCDGRRFKESALEINYKGKNIADVLNMSIDEAFEMFSSLAKFSKRAKLLKDIGLGYLRLGQSLATLSNGEKQRLKVAKELLDRKKGERTLYIMDEPSSGLHPKEVNLIIKLIQNLIENNGTVVAIEHNMDFVKASDYIIDIGPGGGKFGGKIVVEGPLKTILKSKKSITAQYLKSL